MRGRVHAENKPMETSLSDPGTPLSPFSHVARGATPKLVRLGRAGCSVARKRQNLNRALFLCFFLHSFPFQIQTRAQARVAPVSKATHQHVSSKQSVGAASVSSHASAASSVPSHPLTRNAAKAAAAQLQEEEEEEEALHSIDDAEMDEEMREDSQQPGSEQYRRAQQQQEDEDAEFIDEDEELISAKEPPHAHHKHATAHLHVAPSPAAAAASAAESAPLMPAAAAAAAVASRAPLAFADQATWQQCLSDPCQEYADSIYQHLRATELAHFPDPLYMDTVQGDLTHAMRSILVDWLVEVAEEYKLAPQSLFLAVSYLDRFLSRQQIDRSRLQLVGVTALLLAAKYWEIYPPAIDEFVYISDHTYTKAEVLAMENSLLTALHFKLTTPTSWEFSRRFCKAANADKQTEHLVDVSDTKETRGHAHGRYCLRPWPLRVAAWNGRSNQFAKYGFVSHPPLVRCLCLCFDH